MVAFGEGGMGGRLRGDDVGLATRRARSRRDSGGLRRDTRLWHQRPGLGRHGPQPGTQHSGHHRTRRSLRVRDGPAGHLSAAGILQAYLDVFNVYNGANLRGYFFQPFVNNARVQVVQRPGEELLPILPTIGFRWEF